MRIIKKQTAIAKVSDLRYQIKEVLDQVKEGPVELEKHNKPVAVLLDPKRYARMEELLEETEDILLALEARQRLLTTKESDYLTFDEVKKRLR